MAKVKTREDNKQMYVSPATSCLNVNYNICAYSVGGGHESVDFGENFTELDVTEPTNP